MKNFQVILKTVIILFTSILIITMLFDTKSYPHERGSKFITRHQMPYKWIFTKANGTLKAVQYSDYSNDIGVIFEADGVEYAVNGIAKGHAQKYGYEDANVIIEDDTDFINDLIKAGVPKDKAKGKKDIFHIVEMAMNL